MCLVSKEDIHKCGHPADIQVSVCETYRDNQPRPQWIEKWAKVEDCPRYQELPRASKSEIGLCPDCMQLVWKEQDRKRKEKEEKNEKKEKKEKREKEKKEKNEKICKTQ
ncbi:hypothetical protein LZ554_009469 [Drepanopeziza brunnea f. sp. 'monogermtubi']|nr:hypothetical protein LZ554_009469 [Drepanopeziza brunnea f. sp. 'monogermtubi']